MKYINKKIALIFGISLVMLSFTKNLGGDCYSIQLNNKEIAQQCVFSKAPTPTIALNGSASSDQLSVYYSECGKIGQARKLTLKDDQEKTLKEWNYANVVNEHSPMNCSTKEIAAVIKDKNAILKLYYTSKQVSKERLLATINFTNASASNKK